MGDSIANILMMFCLPPGSASGKIQDLHFPSPQQIAACIRAYKTMLLPSREETNYFERLRSFAKVKKLTVTKITPYYYDAKQMLGLVEKHLNDADAIQFIADMLETGDPDNDGLDTHGSSAIIVTQSRYSWPRIIFVRFTAHSVARRLLASC